MVKAWNSLLISASVFLRGCRAMYTLSCHQREMPTGYWLLGRFLPFCCKLQRDCKQTPTSSSYSSPSSSCKNTSTFRLQTWLHPQKYVLEDKLKQRTLNSFRSLGEFSVIVSHRSLNILLRLLHCLIFSANISCTAFRSSGFTRVTPPRNFSNFSSISFTWNGIIQTKSQFLLKESPCERIW